MTVSPASRRASWSIWCGRFITRPRGDQRSLHIRSMNRSRLRGPQAPHVFKAGDPLALRNLAMRMILGAKSLRCKIPRPCLNQAVSKSVRRAFAYSPYAWKDPPGTLRERSLDPDDVLADV